MLNGGKTLIYFPHGYVSSLLSYSGQWYKENGHIHGLQKNKFLVRKNNAPKPNGSFTVCLQRIPELFTICKYLKELVKAVIINMFKE